MISTNVFASGQGQSFPFEDSREKAYDWLEKNIITRFARFGRYRYVDETAQDQKPMVLSVLLYDFMLQELTPEEAVRVYDSLSLGYIRQNNKINVTLHQYHSFLYTLLNFRIPLNKITQEKATNALRGLEIMHELKSGSILNFKGLEKQYQIKHQRFCTAAYFLEVLKFY